MLPSCLADGHDDPISRLRVIIQTVDDTVDECGGRIRVIEDAAVQGPGCRGSRKGGQLQDVDERHADLIRAADDLECALRITVDGRRL